MSPPPAQPDRGAPRDQTPASGGEQSLSFQQPPKCTPPTLPAVALQRSLPPSLRHVLAPDQHVPGLSYSHPTSRGSPPPATPQPQDSLLACPFTWGARARPESTPKLASGAQRQALALGPPGSNRPPRGREKPGSGCGSRHPPSVDGKAHQGNRPQRQAGREGGLREPGPPSAPSPHPLCPVPLPPGAGKPRSSHRRENRATKCDQTHKVTQVGPSPSSPLGATPALAPPRPEGTDPVLPTQSGARAPEGVAHVLCPTEAPGATGLELGLHPCTVLGGGVDGGAAARAGHLLAGLLVAGLGRLEAHELFGRELPKG